MEKRKLLEDKIKALENQTLKLNVEVEKRKSLEEQVKVLKN